MRRLMRIGVCAAVALAAIGFWVAGAGSKTLPRGAAQRAPKSATVPAVRGTTCFIASGSSVCSRQPCTVFIQSGIAQPARTVARVPNAAAPRPATPVNRCGVQNQPLAVPVPSRPGFAVPVPSRPGFAIPVPSRPRSSPLRPRSQFPLRRP